MPRAAAQPKKPIRKKTSAPRRRAAKTAAVIPVEQSSYWTQSLSPHIVDLRPFAPVHSGQQPWELPVEESVDAYFATPAATTVNFATPQRVVDLEKEQLSTTIAPPFEQAEEVTTLRQEIAAAPAVVEDMFAEVESQPIQPVSSQKQRPVRARRTVHPLRTLGHVMRRSGQATVATTAWAARGVGTSLRAVAVRTGDGVAAVGRGLPLSPRLRATVAFTLMVAIIMSPIGILNYLQSLRGSETKIIQTATAAAGALTTATDAVSAQDFLAAHDTFGAASQQFAAASDQLNGVNRFVTALAKLIPTTRDSVTSASALLLVGEQLSRAGAAVASGLDAWQNPDKTLTEKLALLRTQLLVALPAVRAATTALPDIDPKVVPPEAADRIQQLKTYLPAAVGALDDVVALTDFGETFLGRDGLKRYLIVFQNNHEIRPTGGFIGSFALVDIANGTVKNIEVPGGGSYDLQGSLRPQVAAPGPLRLINPRWEFQDSNWFPDFPTAAQKMEWFYENAGGPTVDGVIAINASVVESLLDIVGPITVDGKLVTADNFFDVTQRAVELDYDKVANRPKEFIGNAAPILFERLLSADQEQLVGLIAVLNDGVTRHDIQLALTDPNQQAVAQRFGWDGAIRQAPQDYLMVVNSNIAGQKTDGVISQKVFHQAKILSDGRVIDTVKIIREHHGIEGQQFSGVRNVNYVRLYVPQGSTLLSASGLQPPDESLFKSSEEYQQDADLVAVTGLSETDPATGVKINTEFGKTVFGGWTQVYPGKTMVTTFEYQLPFTVSFARYHTSWAWLNALEARLQVTVPTATYSALFQKQSGVESDLYSFVEFPADWQPLWQSPAALAVAGGQASFTAPLTADQAYGVIFQQTTD